MEFTRRKKKGQNQKVRKHWFADDYRIIWRQEVCGVEMPAGYQTAVRVIVPNYSGKEGESFEMWDFVDPKHRLFKVFHKAQESCERHKRLWEKACEATGIRGLLDIFGKLPESIPVWARKKLPHKLYDILSRPRTGKRREECEPSPGDPTRTSDSFVGTTGPIPESPIPALPVEVEDACVIPISVPVSSTPTGKSPAKPAKAPAKARKKPAEKRTSTRSKPSGGKKPSTRSSSTNGKKPSKSSRKPKSKLSEN